MKKQKHQLDGQEWLAQIYLGLLLTAFVLYPGLQGYTAMGEAKKQAVFWLTGGYVLLALGLQLELLLTGQRHWKNPLVLLKNSSWPQRLVLLYLALSCISALLSPYDAWHGVSRGEGLWTILLFTCSFLLLSIWGRLQTWMVYGFGAAISLCCLISIGQLLGYNPLGLFPSGLTYYDSEIAYHGAYLGTVGNADLTAALLTMAVAMFAVFLWKGKDKRRFWLLLPLAMSLLVLIWSGVSAGLVALVLGVLLCIPALLKEDKKRGWSWLLAALVLAAGLVAVWQWSPDGGALYELHELLHGRVEDSFGSYRIYIWRQVLDQARDHLLFGLGPDTLSEAALDGFYTYNAAGQMTEWVQIDLAHNEYLQILVSQGLFALLAYLGALILSLAGWLRNGWRNCNLAVCGSAVLWYSVQIFFGFSLCPTAPIFWAFWALMERENREERERV